MTLPVLALLTTRRPPEEFLGLLAGLRPFCRPVVPDRALGPPAAAVSSDPGLPVPGGVPLAVWVGDVAALGTGSVPGAQVVLTRDEQVLAAAGDRGCWVPAGRLSGAPRPVGPYVRRRLRQARDLPVDAVTVEVEVEGGVGVEMSVPGVAVEVEAEVGVTGPAAEAAEPVVAAEAGAGRQPGLPLEGAAAAGGVDALLAWPGRQTPLAGELVDTALAAATVVVATSPALVVRALAWGAPTVTTPAAARALGALPGREVLVADTDAQRRELAAELAADDGRAATLGWAGRLLVERRFDLPLVAAQLAGRLGLTRTSGPLALPRTRLAELGTPPAARIRSRLAAAVEPLSPPPTRRFA